MIQSVRSVICSFVESMLPRHRNIGLRLVLKCSLDHWSDLPGADIHESRDLELLFHRPYNYTKVYGRLREVRKAPPEIWEKFSDHDSCWRDEAFNKINELFYEQMLTSFTEKGINYPDIKQDIQISIFEGGPEFVSVESAEAIDKDKTYPKFYRLSIGRKLQVTFSY